MSMKQELARETSLLDPTTEICSDCGRPCEGITVDNGIGPYEAGGRKGVDHFYEYLSDCCEAFIYINGSYYEGPSQQDIEEEKADAAYERMKEEQLWEDES